MRHRGWAIIWKPAAKRSLRRLNGDDARRIVGKVENYAATGDGDVKPLKGFAGHRLRVGTWRVFLVLDARQNLLVVLDIKTRGDAY